MLSPSPSLPLSPSPFPALELPVRRLPYWLRPAGWSPLFGERVIFLRGGGYPARIVRVGLADLGEDRFPIAYDRLIGSAPLARLWPILGWEAARERAALEASEEIDQTAARSDSDEPF